MRAMILAAGLGTRLRPLTDNKPKALVEIEGKTQLEIVLTRLKMAGIEEVIINLHHHAGMIKNYLKSNDYFDMDIYFSDETSQLLDTGGGIKKAGWFFMETGEPFLVHNVDILTNIDLIDLAEYHGAYGGIATLAVKHRDTSRSLLLDSAGSLIGWRDNRSREGIMAREDERVDDEVAFSGIQVLSTEIFELMNEKPPFSVIHAYLRLARQKTIRTYNHDYSYWLDMGKKENFAEAAAIIKSEFK